MITSDRYLKQKTKEKLLQGASTIQDKGAKEKILFYLTDFSLLDLGENPVLDESKREEILKEAILKEEAYYYEKRSIYTSFVFFKEKYNVKITQLLALYYEILAEYNVYSENKVYINILNEIIDLLPEEKTLYATHIVHNKLKGNGSINNYKDLKFNTDMYYSLIEDKVESCKTLTVSCKKHILLFKKVTEKILPILPFRDWTKYQENKLKLIIKNIQKIAHDENKYSKKTYPKLKDYEELKENITEADVQDFINSSL